MHVRRAQPEDADAIADVHTRTWQAAYEHVFGADRLATLDAEPRRALWRRSLGRTSVWVAVLDERVVGFVSIGDSREAASEGELYAIYVLPEAWGSGAGAALMREAAAALRASYPTSVLWVLEDNPRARRFYEREGWTLDGATKTDEFLGVEVGEVRYRLGPSPP